MNTSHSKNNQPKDQASPIPKAIHMRTRFDFRLKMLLIYKAEVCLG